MDAQYPGFYPPQRLMGFNADDLDVGPLVEFEQPVTEVHRHPDAAIPATPPRPRGNSDIRIDTASSTPAASTTPLPLRRNLSNHYQPGDTAVLAKEYVMNITVKEALRSRGAEAERVILKELSQMIDKKVWTPVHMSVLTNTEKHGIIRSQMFLKEKYLPNVEFEKLKVRLVAGGN